MTINLHQIKYFIRHYFAAKRNGHGVHSPFVYALCENVFYNDHDFYELEELRLLRKKLLSDVTEIRFDDHGAGSKAFKKNTRKINEIVAWGTSSEKQSGLLFRLINFLNCSSVTELGASVGLNSLYLAKANRNGQVTTIEASGGLVKFAKRLASDNKVTNIQFVHGLFDDVFPKLMEREPGPDLIYIDGNHSYDATLRYFGLALKKKTVNRVLIFDDIYWSPGMTKAWNETKKHPDITASIDLFYFGILFFRPEIKEKIELKLFI